MDSEKSPTFTKGDSPLHIAVRHNHLEDVKKILHRQSVDVNGLNSEHETPLHLACYLNHKHKEIVNVLIAFGADPFIKKFNGLTSYQMCNYDMLFLMKRLLLQYNLWIDSPILTDGDTPLHTAIRQGEIDKVQRIIVKQVIDVNAINSNHETPLHVACVLGYKLIARIVVSNGGDLYKRDCYNNTPIHRAVSKGHADVVDSLITKFECDPKVTGYQGRTLLHFACGVGHLELVTMLIEKYDLSPFAADAVKQTPLHIAASHGQEQVADLLISKYNFPVDCTSGGCYTPLHLACYCGHISLVKQLVLDHKADLKVCNDFLDTPLHLAALGGHTDFVKMLIVELNCCPDVKGFRGRSVLHYSCISGSVEQTVMLITEFNQDPFIVDNNGDTPLHLACMFGHEELVTLLIVKYNCPVDVKNIKFKTPLHLACAAGHQNVARTLIGECRASTNARDHQNDTPLNEAVLHKRTDLVKILITEFNCNPFVKGFQGRSLLHQACVKGHIELAELLIVEFGLDVHASDDEGTTALHMACWGGYEELARLLITKYNCSVDVKSLSNETLLHLACSGGHLNVVRMLVSEYNLDLNALNNGSCSPLHIAARLGHIKTVRALINEFNCKPNAKGYNGRNILHYACEGGKEKLVEVLINDFKIDPMSVDDEGNTAIHVAAEYNEEEVIKLLIIKYNCPVDSINFSGQTSLHIAAGEGYIDLCITLLSVFGADRNIQDYDQDTPLNNAIMTGNAKTVHILAHECGCKSHIKGDWFKPLIHQVCINGSTIMLKQLISNFGYDPTSIDQERNTLLHTAAQHEKYAMVDLLITAFGIHCPVDSRNIRNETPLHLACIAGDTRMADILLSHKATINLRDIDNDTPLRKAFLQENNDVVSSVLYVLGFESSEVDSNLVYDVCKRGFVELLDVLLTDFCIDPCSALDHKGNTALHVAAYGSCKEVSLLLINHGCPVDCRNYNGRTPIYFLCCNKLTDSVNFLLKWFVSELKADVHIKDDKGNQPIHVSAINGCTILMTTLILDYGCDPEARGFKDRTLLHKALYAGQTSTAKSLIDIFHLSLHSIDDDGNTPLHLSSFAGQHESVSLLLYDYHVPIFVRNKSGKTAIDLAEGDEVKKDFREYISSKHHSIQLEYEELKSLSQKKYSGEQIIMRVFVLGHPESGKSTLVESLKRKGISSIVQVPKSDVASHTEGIVPSIHQRKDSRRLLYYDFAGDSEYYSSHSAILEMVSKSSVGTSVYVVVANLMKDDSTLCGELGYWLSFISYHAKNIESRIKLKVVVVLSHHDLLSLADSTKRLENTKQYLHRNSSQLQQWNLDIIDVIVSNCRKPRSSRTLDHILQQISMDTPPYSLSFESTLLNGVLEKDFKHVVACKFQDILSHIKDTGICLPTIASALYPIVKQLHDIGLLMIVGRRENHIEDYLLLMNTSSLTNEVHQLLFSQSAMQTLAQAVPLQYAKIGIFPESVICSILPDHITKDCLIQLQYCHEFTHAEVGLDYSVTPNIESDNLLLYFPALCKLESEQSNWSPDPNLDFSIGWYAKCTGNLDFLPPRYLHVLLLRLTFMFALPPGSLQTSDFDLSLSVPKENCHCTMWKNGIHWLMSEGIECVIEVVNESRGVVVVVKSRKKHTYQCVQMLAQIVNVITEAKHEFCYSVSFQNHIMNSDDPSSYSNEDKLFEISKIKSALHNQDETVISESGHVTLDLENVNFIKCHTYWGKFMLNNVYSILYYYTHALINHRVLLLI